jgi:hypothetical protein
VDPIWSKVGPATHIGNVSEYNSQFFDSRFLAEHRVGWQREGDHYASLALFYSPNPSLVLLPVTVHLEWLDWICEKMRWSDVEVVGGLNSDPSICNAIRHRSDVMSMLKARDHPVISWGETPQFVELLSQLALDDGAAQQAAASEAVRFGESKIHSRDVFVEAAAEVAGIRVPRARVASNVQAAAGMIAERSALGLTSVLKAEFGVAGYGTAFAYPNTTSSTSEAERFVRQLIAEDSIFLAGRLLVEDFVEGRAKHKDLTFDAVVTAGEVVSVGAGVMNVDSSNYVGVTVGREVLPSPIESRMDAFARRVGEALKGHGYVGWFNIDFIADGVGQIWPAEINTRRSGPTIAWSIKSRFDSIAPHQVHRVRTLDIIPLALPVSSRRLLDHVRAIERACSASSVEVVPLLSTASEETDPYPYFGVALVSSSESVMEALTALDRAEAVIRQANMELGCA